MFEIVGHTVTADGRTIRYQYSAHGEARLYFDASQPFQASYDVDVADVPASIALIPLLANVAPIAWFAGFDIVVPELDRGYYNALLEVRGELARQYPQLSSSASEIRVGRIIDNQISGERSAALFSGGVDAFATLYRHLDELPVLITIRGADIEMSDQRQWDDVLEFNTTTAVLAGLEKRYLCANMRTFYTYHVDLLLEGLGWWGMVQHGLAMLSLVAPLSYRLGLRRLYIASSYSVHMESQPWGSLPTLDERISWGGVEVVHDGWELRRQDKVDLIVEMTARRGIQTPLRVCYSEFKDGLNCSTCEKCLRTSLGIILSGGDPRAFSLITDAGVYRQIEALVAKGFSSHVVREFWLELCDKARNESTPFVFSDQEREAIGLARVVTAIWAAASQGLVPHTRTKRLKHMIIGRFPKLFAKYLRLRRSFQ